ncbi:MAG: hypothetical protein JWN14_2760 [Chthonomonadales bacterium]|nr:hypothetical protein [Chthonomonadales bacterium]
MPPPEENVPTPENSAPPPGENLPPETPVPPPGENLPPENHMPLPGENLPPSEPHAPPSEHHEPPSEYDLSSGSQAAGNQAPGGQTPPHNDYPPPHDNFPPSGNPGPFCPKCNQPYDPSRQFCPHCGFMVNPVPQPKFLAGSAVVDVILALLLCVLCAPLMVTAIIPLITYFLVHREYVAFRKGLAAGLILYALIILGALAFCGWIFYAMSVGEKH